MARKERARSGRSERLDALVRAGDHGAARSEARLVLASADASEPERAAATGVIASLAPDRGVVVAGAIAVAIALAVLGWAVLSG